MKKKKYNDISNFEVYQGEPIVPEIEISEWEINAEVDAAKRIEALKLLKNGYKTRKVAIFLGITVDKIKRIV